MHLQASLCGHGLPVAVHLSQATDNVFSFLDLSTAGNSIKLQPSSCISSTHCSSWSVLSLQSGLHGCPATMDSAQERESREQIVPEQTARMDGQIPATHSHCIHCGHGLLYRSSGPQCVVAQHATFNVIILYNVPCVYILYVYVLSLVMLHKREDQGQWK